MGTFWVVQYCIATRINFWSYFSFCYGFYFRNKKQQEQDKLAYAKNNGAANSILDE